MDFKVGNEFIDYNSCGKDRKWAERKSNSIIFSNKLHKINKLSNKVNNKNIFSSDVIERSCTCCDTLLFREQDNNIKLEHTFFCKNKLCPLCSWRKSRKHSEVVKSIIEKFVVEYPNARYLHVTFSDKNCNMEDLSVAFTELNKAFYRMMKYKKIDDICLGYMRSAEVTYSVEHNNFNQHLHCLIAVKPSYFKGSNYISHSEWVEMWQNALKVDYTPIIHVQRVKGKELPFQEEINENITIDKALFYAILETCKYPVKPLDLSKINEEKEIEVMMYLFMGLKGKRQVGFGKEFARIKKTLKVDEEDLIKSFENKEEVEHLKDSTRIYTRFIKKYYRIMNVRKVSREELILERQMDKQFLISKLSSELNYFTND